MCISNHLSNSTKDDNNSTSGVQNLNVLSTYNGNDSRFEYKDALENMIKEQLTSVRKMYETELKQHLFNIERKLDVLYEV